MFNPFVYLFKGSLVMRILIAVCLASLLYLVAPSLSSHFGILGNIFVTLLRAIAPFLVFVLLISSITQASAGLNKTIRLIVFLYVFSTVAGSFIAAGVTFLMPPVILQLANVDANVVSEASNIVNSTEAQSAADVLRIQLLRIFENPISALANGNFMAVLGWSIAFGVAFRQGNKLIKDIVEQVSNATSRIVGWIVQLAPIGVFGILSEVLVEHGVSELLKYAQLIGLLCLVFGILVVFWFPLVGIALGKKNPFPLWIKCLTTSGVSAFLTRSSAANIPVNLDLCRQMNLSSSISSFTIPLGANINLIGASCTVAVLSITAAHSLGIEINFWQALISCIVASICALGASGIPGGSLIMIPIAASAFGISPEVASSMIAVGFIIGVIQDSFETMINSSGDLYYTALVCERAGLVGDNSDPDNELPSDAQVYPHGM